MPTCGFYKICDFSQLTIKHKKIAKDDKHVSVISGTIKRDSNMPLPYTCNAPINVKPRGGGVGQTQGILTFSGKPKSNSPLLGT